MGEASEPQPKRARHSQLADPDSADRSQSVPLTETNIPDVDDSEDLYELPDPLSLKHANVTEFIEMAFDGLISPLDDWEATRLA